MADHKIEEMLESAGDGREHLERFLATLKNSDAVKAQALEAFFGVIRRDGAADVHALYGLDLYDHAGALREHGFRFAHRRAGGAHRWEHRRVTESVRAFVSSLPVECELVPVHGPAPSAQDFRDWRQELAALARDTDYTVQDSGIAFKVRRDGRTLQIVRDFVTFRRWVWIMRAKS